METGISTSGLKEMMGNFLAAPVVKRACTCPFCLVNKVYKADECRLTLSFGNMAGPKMQEIVEAVTAALPELEKEEEVWIMKFGRAPAGHQERGLQFFLETLHT